MELSRITGHRNLDMLPQQFEVDYYKDRFDQGTTDWNTTLVFFAESPENIALVGHKNITRKGIKEISGKSLLSIKKTTNEIASKNTAKS